MRARAWARGTVLERALVLAVVLATGCQDPRPASSPDQPLGQRFQAELEALHGELKFPGATAAYVLPDGTEGVAAAGLADVEAGTPMTAHSRMLAASIGKSVVGAEVIALALDGRLGLDDRISKWLGDRPWFERLPNHASITIRHLLTHSAGIADHVYEEKFHQAFAAQWRDPGNPLPPEALVEFVLDRKPLFAAGDGWAYSDTGYILLGLIIEKAAGATFYEEATRRFLAPLRLTLTEPSDRRELRMLAAGYTAPDNAMGLPAKTTVAPGVMAWNPAVEWTGGGFVSHPRDLAVWAKALYEGKAMAGNYREELLRAVPVTGFFLDLITGGIRYGAGVGIYEKTPLGPTYGHGGGIPGYSSSMRYYPKHGFAVAFQVNTDIDPDRFSGDMESRLARVVADSLRR
jgi:D-alanyl-D-alanine carboxypeptidase